MGILAAARGNLRLVWGTGKSGTFKTPHTGRVELSYFEGQKAREREITVKTEAVAKLFAVCGWVEFERGRFISTDRHRVRQNFESLVNIAVEILTKGRTRVHAKRRTDQRDYPFIILGFMSTRTTETV